MPHDTFQAAVGEERAALRHSARTLPRFGALARRGGSFARGEGSHRTVCKVE